MDASFSSNMFTESGPLNKRRRFVPSTDLFLTAIAENGEMEGQGYDSPLLLQVDGRTPTQQEIEAELLRVGMRIRKSVSDGYKTVAFTPRPFFNMHRLSPATQAALCSGLDKQPTSTATFCGINLAALAHVSSTPIEEQRMWSYSTSHKRGCEGDSDSDDQEFMPQTPTLGSGNETTAIPVDYFSIDFDDFEDVSPMTQINDSRNPQISGRRFAKMRSRKQQPVMAFQGQPVFNPFAQLQVAQPASGNPWMGHKRMTSCGVEAKIDFNDFAEASFLQRREDVDMDCS